MGIGNIRGEYRLDLLEGLYIESPEGRRPGLQTGLVKVARTSEIPAGGMKAVSLGVEEVMIANVQGKFFAIGDRCTHVGGPLHEGELEGKVVTCPWHGSQFDVTNGQVVGPPARLPVVAYEVVVQGEDVMIRKKT